MASPPAAPPPEGGRGSSDHRPLPSIRPENASLVIIHATGTTKLASLNPFTIKKVIDYCAGVVCWVKKLASGDLLVKTNTSKQVKDLLQLRKFHEYDVEATIPVSMNSCRGVISCRDLLMMDERDIVDEMKNQDVIACRHITRFVDGERKKTATVIITFGKASLPEHTYIGYEKVNVRPYIPNPLRCFKCQQYGHHGNSCRAPKLICGKCAEEGHAADSCTSETLKCVACGAAHSISSRDCPVWLVEKEVCTVKAREGISYFDARKKVKELHATPKPGASYASVVNAKPQMCSVATQTCSVSTQTEPTPAAPSTSSTSDASLTIDLNPTTDASTTISYSEVISTTSTDKKNDKKSNKDKVNLTPLNKQALTHVIARPAPTRETSRSSSRSVESRDMEVATSKYRDRSPGSRSPRQKKRNKHTEHPKKS